MEQNWNLWRGGVEASHQENIPCWGEDIIILEQHYILDTTSFNNGKQNKLSGH